jgi:hypothetical protein
MKEYMLIFINNYHSAPLPSKEDLQNVPKQWKDWFNEIAAKGKLSNKGNRLGLEGKLVKSEHLILDGPFTESKEIVGGYILIHADSLEQAAEIATGCPILQEGGKVEVRNLVEMS